jgi:hypothetical protein
VVIYESAFCGSGHAPDAGNCEHVLKQSKLGENLIDINSSLKLIIFRSESCFGIVSRFFGLRRAT